MNALIQRGFVPSRLAFAPSNRDEAVKANLGKPLVECVANRRTRLDVHLGNFDDDDRLLGILSNIDMEHLDPRLLKRGFDFRDARRVDFEALQR
jgi:hypothetical protein